jgi:cob(I)alamin adenosyltransferase
LLSVKIYTKTGDKGETSLLGGDRVRKDAIRVVAYGDVDETNAAIGLALAADPLDFERPLLASIQADLLAIGGRLASPAPELVAKALKKAVIPAGRIGELEAAIDRADAELEPLHEFILPGGSVKGAQLHLARTVCRRAERSVVTLQRESSLDPEILRYLNRLSDLLFMLARLANHRAGIPDVKW